MTPRSSAFVFHANPSETSLPDRCFQEGSLEASDCSMRNAQVRLALIEPDPTAGGGFLVISEGPSSSTIELRRHELDVLKALSEAFDEDRDLLPNVRGWRRVGTIAEIIGRKRGYKCEKQTISRYLCNIRAAIRKKTGSADIAWLEDSKRYGSRLTAPMATMVLAQ